MAQIIKHRRGLIGGVKNLTARNGELIIASGSISDLSGPFVFIGSPNTVDEGVAGAFNSVSKLYTGTAAPTITAATYGSALDGTPYYASGNKSLYILNNSNVGNTQIDLTGNIEGNTISGVTINKLQSTTVSASFFTGSFRGDGTGLYNVPASGVTGLELNQIGQGNVTASITEANGFNVNTNAAITGTLNVNGDTSITGTFVATDGAAFINQGVISQNSNLLLTSGSNLIIQDSGNIEVAGNVYITGSQYVDDVISRTGNGFNALHLNGGTYGAPDVELTSANNISLLAEGGNVNVTGSLKVTGDATLEQDLYVSGNIYQTGSFFTQGDIVLSGSINIGNDITGDTINFGGEVNSNILPTTGATYDLGSSGKTWNNVWAETAHFSSIVLEGITLDSLALPGDLTVSGTTVLSGSVSLKDLTEKRLVVAGVDGLLTDYSGLTFDNGNLNVSGAIEVTNIQGTGSLYLQADKSDIRYFEIYNTSTTDTHIKSNGGLSFFGDDTNYLKIDDSLQTATLVGVNGVIVSSSLHVTGSIYNDQLTDNRIVLAGVAGELEDDANFTFDGTTFKIGVGDFEVDVLSGDTRISGSLLVKNNIELTGSLRGQDASSNWSILGNGFGETYIQSTTGNMMLQATTGEVTVKTGNFRVETNAKVDGTLQVSGSTSLTGSAQFSSTINVDGVATVSSSVVEDLTQYRVVGVGSGGALIDYSGLTYNGTVLKIGGGQFEVDNADGDIRTSGSLTANGLTNNGNLTVNGDLSVTGATGLQSTLDVTGSATLKSTLEVKGATGLNSTLDVTGSAVLKSSLEVGTTTELKGAVGVNSTLDVTGSAILKSTLEVKGATGLNSTLDVTGSVTFKDSLSVTGATTINGLTTINDDATVNGVLTVTGETQLQGNLYVSGNLEILGSATNVTIQSQTVDIGDNIIQVNAYSPFDRYAGLSAYDSGSSGESGSFLWDSTNDYWLLVNANSNTSKVIGTTASTGGTGTEISLTSGTFPIATASNTIGDSLLTFTGTTLAFNTNKFTVDSESGATAISGNLTLSYSGGTDGGTKTSAVTFRNSSNVLGFVSTTETTNELDGILGYNHSSGVLEFSTLIDGGTY
jgi:cytoskeletal protein CcmA (bactofilin family)